MSFLKLPLLLGIVSATTLAAHAQNGANPNSPSRTYTAVDAFGNLVRSSIPRPANKVVGVADQAVLSAGTVVSSDRTRRDRDRNRDRDDKIRGGTRYYSPSVPFYPYPYPVAGFNNYYFPEQPTTTVIGPSRLPWANSPTITSIPLGTSYYGGYPAPGYPSYPGYPAYPAPVYGYPAPAYPYPAPIYGYPAYPPYGTTTYVYGSGNGSIYSQSQSGGYGVSLGNGGLSVQFGNRRSTSSTTVTRY